jgi:hypothetical protein
MIKKITIEVIPHLAQRYNTIGDWQFERDSEGKATALNVKVSDLDDQEYFILIGLHEAIEALLCETKGVKESEVDEFDMNWNPQRVHWNTDRKPLEPGEDYNAPYYEQHQIASGIERLIAARMWVNWARYECIVDELVERSEVHFAEKGISEVTLVSEEPVSEEPVATFPERAPGSSDFDDDIPF